MKDLVNDGFRNVVKPYIDGEDKKSREIIAPVEVSPAEAAHSIGDQIIFGGILYDVIAAIAIGDTLATSGAGENISAADDITTQLKNHTVTTDATPTKDSTNPVQSGGVYSSEKAIYEVMGQNGAKNLLPFNLADIIANNTDGIWSGNTYSRYGITFTLNDNGSITVRGTSTGVATFFLYGTVSAADKNIFKGHVLNGGVSSDLRIQAQVFSTTSPSSSLAEYQAKGEDVVLVPVTNGDYIRIYIRIASGRTISDTTFYPMIRLASDTDPTYQPFAETNQQLTSKTTGLWDNMMDNGAVNISPNNFTGRTDQGITFVVNADKTVTASTGSGGATANGNVNISFPLKKGTYRLTGCPSGGSSTNYRLYVNAGSNYFDYGDGVEFTLSSDTTVTLYCSVISGTVLTTPITFKPMLSDPSLNLSYDDYVPYAMSNRELTEDVSQKMLQYNFSGGSSIFVTSDGVKSKKTLLNELANAFVAKCQSLASDEWIEIKGLRIDDGEWFLPNNSYMYYKNNQTTLSATFYGYTFYNSAAITFKRRGINTTLNSCIAKSIVVDSNGVTLTSEEDIVPASGFDYLLSIRVYKVLS